MTTNIKVNLQLLLYFFLKKTLYTQMNIKLRSAKLNSSLQVSFLAIRSICF